MANFSHINKDGEAKMVDVGYKNTTRRTAAAFARVILNPETFGLLSSCQIKKGDVLTVAQIAGIMSAKHTSDLIPLCHPVMMEHVDVSLQLCEEHCSVEITATVSCESKTGVEMEALTAVSVAALTVYDMCKSVQRDIVISNIHLLSKTGGIHGDYTAEVNL